MLRFLSPPAWNFCPASKNVGVHLFKRSTSTLQPGRLTIYLNRIFNRSSIQYIHTRLYPFASTGKLSVSKPRSCRPRPSRPNDLYVVLTQSCLFSFMNSQSISSVWNVHNHLKICCWKMKIPHKILLKWLIRTGTITSTVIDLIDFSRNLWSLSTDYKNFQRPYNLLP
jgi:hypothetical protein